MLISKSSQSLQLSSLCYELSSFWKFWQVRNLRLLFHLFVCLFVCPECCSQDTGRTVWPIITKLDPNMYLGKGYKPIYYVGQRSNNWVTRSKSRSNFEITVTPSIFELQRRSKAQNLGNAPGYQYSIPNFRWHSRRKNSPGPQNFVTFENFKILKISEGSINLTSDMEQSYANNPRKSISCSWRHQWRHIMTTKSAFYIHV